MENYPSTKYNRSIDDNDHQYITGFHITRHKSASSFDTRYYDIIIDSENFELIQDDTQAVRLNGFNYHPDAKIRHTVLKIPIKKFNSDKDKLKKIIRQNSDKLSNVLYTLNTENREETRDTIFRTILVV
jgi:hypothetical protein